MTAAAPIAYVVNSNSGDVSVIDTATNLLVATLTLGGRLRPGSANLDGKHVYVPDSDSDMVWVIDTASNKVLQQIQVGRALTQ